LWLLIHYWNLAATTKSGWGNELLFILTELWWSSWHHLRNRILIVMGTTRSIFLGIKKIIGNILGIKSSFNFWKIALFSIIDFSGAINDTLGEKTVRQSMGKGVFLLCPICHLSVNAWWHTCVSGCLSKSIYFSAIVVLTHAGFTALFIFKTRRNQILFNISDISTSQTSILSLIPNFIWINLNWILVLIHCSGLIRIPSYRISICVYSFPNDILSFSTLNFWRWIFSVKERIRTFEIQIIFSTHVEVKFLPVFCDLFEKWVFFPVFQFVRIL